jgi:cell division protein FtsB
MVSRAPTSGMRWVFRLLLAVVLAAVLGYLPYRAYGPSGIGQVLQLERDLERIESENGRVQLENRELRAQINRLKNDEREVERVARDELGLVRANDLVFLFE